MKPRSLYSFVFFGALGCCISLAAIALPMSSAHAEASEYKARLMVAEYAKCTAVRRIAAVRKLLLQSIDEKSYNNFLGNARAPECADQMGAQSTILIFPADLYRYAMAEALVRKDMPEYTSNDFSAVPPLLHYQPAAFDETKLPQNKYQARKMRGEHVNEETIKGMSSFGECVVRANPAAAFSLLKTGIESKQEEAAFNIVADSMKPCMVSAKSLQFSRASVRGTIALNYYRLASAVRSDASVAE